ncbi:MAG TPA: dienelactone hydrolase family protein [Stellaceae bacterium]|jgi:carboxymethylenebutenolidase|nr:dienelactone hydrolase family protein [Stellaceae bacterium]
MSSGWGSPVSAGAAVKWLYAAGNPAVKAGVAWYRGPLLVGWTPADAGNSAIRQWDREYRPKDPIDLVADLRAPVLGFYGGADPGIPVASVERMREALKAAGKTAEIIVYPETPHAFHSDYRPSYREGRRRMAGSACSSGSSATASPEPGHLS